MQRGTAGDCEEPGGVLGQLTMHGAVQKTLRNSELKKGKNRSPPISGHASEDLSRSVQIVGSYLPLHACGRRS